MTGPDPNADEWSACEAALDDAADPRPGLGDKFALLKQLHRLREHVVGDPATLPQCNATTLDIQRLGRFEVRRELGRGSFGVVYLALDPNLGRDIALKVPHPEVLMTPELRQRFRQEAQVAAALDHPHVSAVHEVGEEGAFCFLVSPYCPGGNLADWLRRQREPMPIAGAAAIIRVLAGAVQHAHERGIIHRDLKPANVLLAADALSADELVNTVRITDFGLAKYVDGSGAATRTGAVVGTPLYMAPEQAETGTTSLGPAVDVYALGAMLYELLTGRTPFTGDSTLDILYQVKNREPLAPRQLRPRLPRDLETICLKCLEKSPAHRYPSAAALADDLGHFLDGRPVHARPVGPLGKAGRRAQRHPTVVVLLVGLFLSLVGGSIGVVTQWRRAERQADETAQQHDRADANLRRAHEAAERLARLGSELADKPGLNKTRQELLESTLAQFEVLLSEQSADPRIQWETAKAARQAGLLRNALGQRDAASAAFVRAGVLLDILLAATPNDAELRAERIRCLHGAGMVMKEVRRSGEARDIFKKAVAMSEALFRNCPDRMECRQLLADNLVDLADHQRSIFEFEYADNSLTRVRELERSAPASAHDDLDWQKTMAAAADSQSSSHWHRKRIPEAETCIMQALAIRERLIAAKPNVASNRFQIAQSISQLGSLRRIKGDIPGAIEFVRQSQQALERLIHDDPDVPLYRTHYSQSFSSLGTLYTMQNAGDEAEAAFRQALDVTQQLLNDFPGDKSHGVFMHTKHLALGNCLKNRDKFPAAIEQFRKAQSFDDSVWVREQLAWALAMAPDPADRDPKEAVRLAELVLAANPNRSGHTILGAARLRAGDFRGALAEFETAAEEKAVQPENSYLQALAWCRLGNTERARQALEQANSMYGRHLDKHPELKRLAAEATDAVAVK